MRIFSMLNDSKLEGAKVTEINLKVKIESDK